MRLGTALLLALCAPVSASPGGDPGGALLRYRVSPGQAYAHQVSMRVQVRVLSSSNVCLPPPQLRSGMATEVSGRVATLIARPLADGSHEVLAEHHLAVTAAGRSVAVPSEPRVLHLTDRRGYAPGPPVERRSAAGPLANSSLVLDSLPEVSLQPGRMWTRFSRHPIPGGPTVTLVTRSRYLGRKTVDGDVCALVEAKAEVPPVRFGEAGVEGIASGRARTLSLYSLATGMPRRGTATMQFTLAFLGKGGKSARVGVDTTVQLRQVPATQRESALARQAAAEGAWSVVADLSRGRTPDLASARTAPEPARTAPAGRANLRTQLTELAQGAARRADPTGAEIGSGPGTPAGAASLTAAPPASGSTPGSAGGATSAPAPPLTLVLPRPGARVAGDALITAEVAAGVTPQFIIFTVDGARVAAVSALPYQWRVPREGLAPGAHVIGVELYGGGHLPIARASVRVRAADARPAGLP